MPGRDLFFTFCGVSPWQALELDKKYVKAWAKKGDIEFFMKEYHKALDSYKMVSALCSARFFLTEPCAVVDVL